MLVLDMKRFCKIFALTVLFGGLTGSIDLFSQCPGLPTVLGLGSNKSPDRLCAAVNADLFYSIRFQTALPTTSTYQVYFFWGDGQPPDFVTIPGGLTTYTNITANHTYPANSDCEYLTQMIIYRDGLPCLSTYQTQYIQSYRTEAFNQGLVRLINPISNTDIFDVCVGQDINAVFNDLTNFNCNASYQPNYPTGAAPIQTPNDLKRWQQIVYNTQVNSGARIPNLRVDGVPVTNASGAPIQPGPNYYQDPRGVLAMNSPVVVGDPRRRSTLNMTAPGGFGAGFPQVGDIFEITIRYWNVCNPYANDFSDTPLNGDFINGDNPPIQAQARIRIITAPPQLTAVASSDYCYGSVLGGADNFAVSGTSGSTTSIRWYNGNPLAGGTFVANPNGTNSTTFPMTAYPASAPGGPINTSRAGGAGGVYALWATQIFSGTNGCESQPVQITRTVRPQLIAPAAPSGIIALCNNTNNVNYSQPAGAAPTSIAANTFTNTGALNFPTEYFWDANPAGGVVFNSGTTGTSVNVNYGLVEPAPPTASTTLNIRTALRYTTAPQCTTTPTPRTVTIFYTSNGGSITANQVICDNVPTANPTVNISLSNIRGTVQSWERDTNGGGFIADGSLPASTSITPAVPQLSGATTVYRFRAVVQNGLSCASVFSPITTVTVNPRPTGATISGTTTICRGASTNLVVNITGGAGPYAVRYNPGNVLVSGYISGANIPVSPTANTTYTLVSVTDANGCTSAANSGSAAVVVKDLSAVVSFVNSSSGASQAICPTANFVNLRFTISDANANPLSTYTVNFQDNLANLYSTGPGYVSGSNFTINNVASTRTFSITSVTEAGTGCTTTNSGSVAITVGSAPASATFSGGGSVCQNAAYNLTLAITGGVPPYQVTITPSVGAPINIPAYVSGTPISVPTGSAGSISYNTTLIQDACGAVLAGAVAGNPQVVTVNPLPIANNSSQAVVCSGTNLSVDPTPNITNGVASTFSWTASYTGGMSGPAAGTGSIVGVVSNLTSSVQTATFTVVPTSTATPACPGSSFTITQQVNPAPVATAKALAALCSPATINIDPQVVGVNGSGGNSVPSNFTWTGNYGALTGGPVGLQSGSITGFTLTNATGAAINAVFTVTPTSVTGSCPGSSFTITVPINPLAIITVQPASDARCVGQNSSFSATATGPGITRQWQVSTDGGVTFTNLSNVAPYSNVTTATLNITGVTAGLNNNQYRVRFTTTGSCVIDSNPGTLTVNPLPVALNPAPVFCETVAGGGAAIGVNLPTFNDGVTGIIGSADRTVNYFSDAARTNNITAIPQNISNTQTIFTRVQTVSTGCTINGTITFTVNQLPVANTQTRQYCEDVIGGGIATGINLNTEFNTGPTGVTAGLANRSIAWFSDGALTSPIAAPTSFTINTVTPAVTSIFAQVTNTLTGCTNVAQVDLSVKRKPILNPIQGNASVCTGNSIVFYQLDPGFNTGSTYTWSIVGSPPAAVQVFGGGGTNSPNFFALLKFPSATGFVDITVTETLNLCEGTPSTLRVTVSSTPTPNTITGLTQVCSNQTNVQYSVASPNVTSTYNWSIPTGANIISSAVGSSINVDFGTVSPVTINVQETAQSTCKSDATLTVFVNPRPVMTSPATVTSCSGTIPVSNFAASLPSNFTWSVPPLGITGTVTGTSIGSSGSGNLNQTLVNISGAIGTVTYNVTPTAIAAPGCQGSPQPVIVTVNPEPVLVSPQTKTICSGDAVNYQILLSPLNLPAGTQLNWGVPLMSDASSQGSASSGFVLASNPLHITDVLVNNTSAPITATYTINAVNPTVPSPCSGVPQTVVITVNPAPQILVPAIPPTVCSTDQIGLNVTLQPGSASASGFNILSRSSLGGLIPSPSNAAVPSPTIVASNYLSTDSYKNLGSSPIPVTYTVEAIGSVGGCKSPQVNLTTSINPEPRLSNSLDRNVCSGENIGLLLATLTGSAAVSGYNVIGVTIPSGLTPGGSNAVIPNSSVGAGYLQSDTYVNTTGAALTVVYQVVPVGTVGNCPGDPPASINVLVRPRPVVNLVSSISVCPGQSVGPFNFSSNTGGGELFTWTNDNTAIGLGSGSNGNIPAFTVIGANLTGADLVANISVNAEKNLCTSTPLVFQIRVKPQPVVSAITDIEACTNDVVGPINFTANTVGGELFTWTNDNTTIGLSGGSTGPISSFTAPANVTGSNIVGNISVFASKNGCQGPPSTFRIIIKPKPVLATIADVAKCPSEVAGPFNFVSNTGGGETILWSNDNTAVGIGATGNANIASYVAPPNLTGAAFVGNITATATKNGCASLPLTFRVTIKPQPVVTTIPDVLVCPGETIGPFNFSANTGGGESFPWTNSNTSVGLPLPLGSGSIASFTAPANITGSQISSTISVTAQLNNCVSTPLNFNVTVKPQPVVTQVADISRCSGQTVNGISFNANTGGGEIVNWTNSNTSIGLLSGGSGNIASYTAPNNITGSDFVGNLSVRATKNLCQSAPMNFTVIIRATPVLNAISNVAVCSSSSTSPNIIGPINFSANTGGGETFTWTNTNAAIGLPFPNGSNNIAAYNSPDNRTNSDFVGTVTVTATKNNCPSAAVPFTITVRPRPELSSSLDIARCSGAVFGQNLATNGISIGAANFNVAPAPFTFADPALVGTPPTTGNALTANALASNSFINTTAIPRDVVYSIVPVGTNSCLGDSKNVIFTINPTPVLLTPVVSPICSNSPTNVTLSTNGTSVGALSYRLVSKLYSTDGGFTYLPVVPANFVDIVTNAPLNVDLTSDIIKNDKFTNTRSGSVIVRYRVTPNSAVFPNGSSCAGAPSNIEITVNAQPTLDPALNPTPVCSGLASGVTLAVAPGSVAAANYNINSFTFAPLVRDPLNSVTGVGQPANAIAKDKYVNSPIGNPSGNPLPAVYKIAPVSSAGCIGAEGTVTLTINAAPALSPGLSNIVCSGNASGITFSTVGVVPAAHYNIVTAPVLDPVSPSFTQIAGNTGVRNNVTTTEISIDRFQNLTNDTARVNYKVEPVSGAGCKGPQVNVVLRVEPTVTMLSIPNASICSFSTLSTATANITLQSNTRPSAPAANAITFNVSATSPGNVISVLQNRNNLPATNFTTILPIQDQLVNNTNAAVPVTYSITPFALGAANGNGCSGVPTVVTINVQPKPKLVITPSTQEVCSGVATTMVLSTPTTPIASVQFTKSFLPPPPGMTSPNAAVNVNYSSGLPIGDIWQNTTNAIQTITYTFGTQSGLCFGDDVTVNLKVKPVPTVTPSVTSVNVCSQTPFQIDLAADPGPDLSGTTTFSYIASTHPRISGASSGSGPQIAQSLRYTSATPTLPNSDAQASITYTITPRANSCDGLPVVVTVFVDPKPILLPILNRIPVCDQSSLIIPLASNVTGAIYQWSIDPVPPFALVTGPAEQLVPIAATSINQPMTNTSGTLVTMNYTVTAIGPGTTACPSDPKISIVDLSPRISATFTNPDLFMCKGRGGDILLVEIEGQAPFNFVYNKNDGITNTNNSVTNAGNFKVIPISNLPATTDYTLISVQDKFGCSPSPLPVGPTTKLTSRVTVNDVDATFVLDPPALSCNPYPANFKFNKVAEATPGEGPFYTWQWRDGTADITAQTFATTVNGQNIQHTFENFSPTTIKAFNANLFVQLNPSIYPFNGCSKTTTQTVSVYPFIRADFNPDVTEICSGGTVTTINQSLGVTSHRWFWRRVGVSEENDVQTSSKASFVIVNNGPLNPQPIEIVYDANNGNCPAPRVVSPPILVYQSVDASFTKSAGPYILISNSAQVTFTNTSTPFDVTKFSYNWTFGNVGDVNPVTYSQTTNAPIPPVDYGSAGLKRVTLTINNLATPPSLSCGDETSEDILIIKIPPQASYDITPIESCLPTTIKLLNVKGTGLRHEWELRNITTGISSVSEVPNPGEFKITSAGEYTISYRTYDPPPGGSTSAKVVKTFKVYDRLQAVFTVRPDVVFVPDTEMFTYNDSEGAKEYDWDFGDGGISDLKEPTYTYKVEGRYDITLVAKFDHGNGVVCRDTLVRKITAKLGGQSKIPNAFTPNPNGPSSGGRGGNGTFNDVFLPIVRGIADEPDAYNLQIYDRWGNLLFESNSSNNGWDGYDKTGKIMPAGVYVYKLTLRFSDTQRTTQVGDVTLIR